MGSRGPKPKNIINEKWNSNLAYAIGLLATDGCMSRPEFGYLIDLTSKDKEQLKNYCLCLGIPLNIGKKYSGLKKEYYRVQFKNRLFYEFLLRVGLTPAKSKTVGPLKIPSKYFFDFLRGVFDGDGYSYSYWDKRWKSSFMFYVGFTSASPAFIDWLRNNIESRLRVKGHITSSNSKSSCLQLKYAKESSYKIFKRMYQDKNCVRLSRKYLKINKTLAIVGKNV